MADKKILFLCPFKAEAKLLTSILPDCRAIDNTHWHYKYGQVITWNGSGQAPLMQAVASINDPGQFSRLVLFGAAGALDPEYTIGQVFTCESVHYQQCTIQLDPPPDFVSTKQITVDQPALTGEARDSLFQNTGSRIVDMEGYFFAQQMQSLQLKFAIIRFISDTATQPFALPFSKLIKLELIKYRNNFFNLF